MSTYRFISTDTITGRVMCDSLPIVGQTCSRQINSVGSFSGSLTFPVGATAAQRAVWTNALMPWKSILWVLQDGHPIWNGPITAWPHTSLSGGNLPLQGATMEEFFKHRMIRDVLTYTNMDIFEIWRQELLYALSKQPNGNIAGSGQFQNQAGIIDSVKYSGVVGSVVESASMKKVYDAWDDLVTTYLMEYTLAPAMTDAGSLYTVAQLGLPQLGRTYDQTGFQLIVPSRHMQDYGWQWAPTDPANLFLVTGTSTDTAYVIVGIAAPELAQGFPLLENSGSFSGTATSEAQLINFTIGSMYTTTILGNLTPVVRSGAGQYPAIKDTLLGDEMYFMGSSDIHPTGPNGAPGVTQLFQMTGWTLTFPTADQAEQTTWQLGAPVIGPLT